MEKNIKMHIYIYIYIILTLISFAVKKVNETESLACCHLSQFDCSFTCMYYILYILVYILSDDAIFILGHFSKCE